MKTCTVCKEVRPLSEFGKDKNSRDGYRSRCKSCVHKDNSRYYHANREARRAAHKAWVKANPEKYREINRKRNLRATERIKKEFVEAYGGACSCCGEDDIHFLTLDHVNGRDGERRTGEHMYRQAKREGFPDSYRLLCFNCNCSIGFFGGCPHDPNFKPRFLKDEVI
jgi:hypothetical protein